MVPIEQPTCCDSIVDALLCCVCVLGFPLTPDLFPVGVLAESRTLRSREGGTATGWHLVVRIMGLGDVPVAGSRLSDTHSVSISLYINQSVTEGIPIRSIGSIDCEEDIRGATPGRSVIAPSPLPGIQVGGMME